MKVVVVELNKYHTETFPIYENLLPAFLQTESVECHYYCHADKAVELSGVYRYIAPIIGNFCYFVVRNLQLRTPFFRWKIQRIIDKLKADVVVFNSIEPERNLNVFKGVRAKRKIAIVHNPLALSLDAKNANEDYFVLSEIVYNKFRDELPLSGYMLPFFKPYPTEPKERGDGKIMIGVQGLVNFKRRDYDFLIELCKLLKEQKHEGVVFNIIGSNNKKGGKWLRELIAEFGLEEYFVLHESLDDAAFFSEVEACDLLMPLLGPKQRHYFEDKTTATFSHAAAYNKPMLLSRENAEAWGLDDLKQYIYEDVETCAAVLQHLYNLESHKAKFAQWTALRLKENLKLLEEKNQ